MKLEAKHKPNSISTIHCLVISSDCWANCVNWVGGGPPLEFQIKRYSSLFTTYSNFCGEKVALTQVVEHHLPTYASLALVWLKVGVKTCMKFEKMKVHHIAKTTKHTSLNMQHPDSKKQRREANCEVLENPLQPILCFFFKAIARLSSWHNFSSSDHHQGMVAVE